MVRDSGLDGTILLMLTDDLIEREFKFGDRLLHKMKFVAHVKRLQEDHKK
jgi:hypothetical protein